jgi:hypothetical protein
VAVTVITAVPIRSELGSVKLPKSRSVAETETFDWRNAVTGRAVDVAFAKAPTDTMQTNMAKINKRFIRFSSD